MKIGFVCNIEGYALTFQEALKEYHDLQDEPLDFWLHHQNNASYPEEDFQQFAEQCDFVFACLMGGKKSYPAFTELAERVKKKKIPFMALGSSTEIDPDLLAASTVKPEETAVVRKYLICGGRENYYNLLLWLCNTYGQTAFEAAPAELLPWDGIYHPDCKAETELENYLSKRYDPSKPTVGVIFFRSDWLQFNLKHHDALIREIEAQGANVIAVFTQGMKDESMGIPGIEEVFAKYFYRQGQVIIDVLINMLKFSILVGRAKDDKDFLKKLDVPIIQAVSLLDAPEDWEASSVGGTPVDLCMSMALPEFDGVIHSVPIAGKRIKEKNEQLRTSILAYEPIPERMHKSVSQALKWANLKRKPNWEKKIAIIFHNYPPTNAKIGNALGLDSPESVFLLLKEMQQQGYTLEKLPENGQEIIAEIIDRVSNDQRFLSVEKSRKAVDRISPEQYNSWFQEFPPKVQQALLEQWGELPGDVFNYEGELLVPGIINGNIFIGLQPPRGFGDDPGKIYHDPVMPPTHYYFAYYRWIRDIFQADAVMHIGTHGNLEWLPGKGVGLSHSCYPDLAIMDLPNIYPYMITITGEGTQAKRRSFACLIEYLPPVITTADSYEDLAEIEVLLNDYYQAETIQPCQLPVLRGQIIKKVEEKNLQTDLGIDLAQIEDFGEFLEKLHGYISEIKDTQIKEGLHTLGCPPEGEGLREYYVSLLRLQNGDIPSLREALADSTGYNYNYILEHKGERIPGEPKTYGQLLEEVQAKARLLVQAVMEADYDLASLQNQLNLISPPYRQKIHQTLSYLCSRLKDNLAGTRQELKYSLHALAGGYVEPGQSGAPTRGMADILPTGRNFYSVDPTAVPSSAAWEVGKSLGDQMLESYLKEEGRYPENVGLIIWAGANMRTKGDCFAEFLYLLGLKPVWQKSNGRVIDLEVIPLQELGRPRIDVTARITGLVRDSLPTAVNLLDRAVELAASLDESEEDNYVRKHILQEMSEYTAAGLKLDEAKEKASYRIFGCPPGGYGAGISDALEAGNWQTIDDLAEVYVTWGAYAYGSKLSGKKCADQFRKRLSTLEVTVKNEDNRERNLLDSDDFNSYHGGMIAAVRSLRGKAPKSFSGDSSDPARTKVRTLNEEVKLIFRSQVLNPKWIKAMQKHGYKGAGDLFSLVSHCYQWDATSKVMDDWMYEELAGKYAFDKQMQEWMKEVNPWALHSLTQTLLEAIKRELWTAKPETKKELTKLYLEMEGELEGRMDND
ncbi:MAG: cobaltochelatase subunit CobN [bacterium]